MELIETYAVRCLFMFDDLDVMLSRHFEEGLDAVIHFMDAYPQHRYPGYVSNIVPTADRAKATVMVKIRFKEYDQRVLPEMGAKVTFLAHGTSADATTVKPLLTVPAAAVAARNGRDVVFQVNEDRAVEVPVTTGRKLGNLIEITGGLKEGDRVISKAEDRIKNGTKVSLGQK